MPPRAELLLADVLTAAEEYVRTASGRRAWNGHSKPSSAKSPATWTWTFRSGMEYHASPWQVAAELVWRDRDPVLRELTKRLGTFIGTFNKASQLSHELIR